MYTLAITVFFFVFGISMLIGKGPNTAAYMAWWIFVLVLPSGLFPISAFVSEGSPLIRLVGLASAIAMLVIGGLCSFGGVSEVWLQAIKNDRFSRRALHLSFSEGYQ